MASGDDETQRVIHEVLAELDPADIQRLARRLALADVTPTGQTLAASAAPVRRRPRRADPVTLRVRVDLVGTKPPAWRRLELASDLFLDGVHEIIQAAFGWTDSHLHRFGRGPTYYSPDTEYYLCPFSVDEGDEGVPEEQVHGCVPRSQTTSSSSCPAPSTSSRGWCAAHRTGQRDSGDHTSTCSRVVFTATR